MIRLLILDDNIIKSVSYITKTCLYNFDPLKPHFYIVKLEFTGVYIIFLISAQNTDCGYSLKPPFVWKFSIFRWLTFQYIWIGRFS